MNLWNQFRLPFLVFLFSASILTMVQLMVDPPMLLLERFLPGSGWIEILLVTSYGALVAYHMKDPLKVQAWRRYTWFTFSVVFFTQLTIGLAGHDKFLMSGELHLPVPMMILAGPIYRGQISVMTILFISTVILSGPAWCSHLCYFGALDSMASKGKTEKGPLHKKMPLKATMMLLVIGATLTLRLTGVPPFTATLLALGFGITGIGIILILSRKQGRMVHCTAYCPIGTIVNYARFINPFRMVIDNDLCTNCMICTRTCKYDALNKQDILNRKPGITCTLCGDCIADCHAGAIKYKFPGLSSASAKNLWLFITISLHAATLALARI
ncbi:MAG: 4Fe-4S binding protein [Bacteroidales bacterium]|nr:4Fe-4S binding protein [Bacteroidales bacterium]